MPGFVREFKVNFPMGVSDGTKAKMFLEIPLFAQAYVPLMAIIDRDGMIREQHTGSERDFFSDDFTLQTTNLRTAINKYLAVQPKPSKPGSRMRPKNTK